MKLYVCIMIDVAVPPEEGRFDPVRIPRASSGFIRDMANSHLLIPGRHIQLLETVGQGGYSIQYLRMYLHSIIIPCAGEFGVVYRGKLTYWKGRTKAELVAVKTLKSRVVC